MDAMSTQQSLFVPEDTAGRVVKFPVDPSTQEPNHVPTNVQRVQEILRGEPNVKTAGFIYLNGLPGALPLDSLKLSQLRGGFTSLFGTTVREFVVVIMTHAPELVITVTCKNPATESDVHYDTHGITLTVSPRQIEVVMATAQGNILTTVPVPGWDKVVLEIDLKDPTLAKVSEALKRRYVD